MALPGNLAQITVTGYITDAQGAPAEGTVTFTLSAELVSPTAKQVILNTPIAVTLVAGQFSVNLSATDDPDVTPTNNFYSCSIALKGRTPETFQFKLPYYTVGPVDLSDVLQVQAGSTTPTYLLMRTSSLTDVDLTGLTAGSTLVWDDTVKKFRPGTGSSSNGSSSADAAAITALQGSVTTLQTTVAGHTTSIASLQTSIAGVAANPGALDIIQPPSAVEDLTATPGVGQVTLTWTAPTVTGGAPVISYLVQKRPAVGSPWGTTTVVTGTTYTATGLTGGVAEQVRVAAFNVAGYSVWSSIIATPTSSGGGGGGTSSNIVTANVQASI